MTALRILGAWAWQVVVSIDQLANALLGGWADETLSSRAWRAAEKGRRPGVWLRPVLDLLFFWDRDHCRESYLSERDGRQYPPELRPTPAEEAARP